jgi:Na+-driven multidrug efflux pump
MNKQLAYNLITNLIALASSVFIAIWMTPFIVNHLGTEAYGFIPLTQNIVNYFAVITVALSSMLSRFFLVSIEQGKLDDAQKYISTYLIAAIILSAVILIILVILSFFIHNFIHIPQYLLTDVRLSLIICSLVFVLSFIYSGFSSAMFCANRLDIGNVINLINILLKTIVTFMLLTLLNPKIWQVNLAVLFGYFITLLLGVYYFKKLMPNIRISKKFFDSSKLKVLLKSGSWSSISQIGVILFLNIDLLVANILFGAENAGKYAAIMQLPAIIRTVASNIAVVFAPLIIAKYAKGDIKGLVAYSNNAVRINGLVIVLPAGLLIGMGGKLLRIWIGPEYESLKWLLCLMTAHLILNLEVMPLNYISTAVNKLKFPAVVSLIFGGVNLILAVLLGKLFGLYGIALASGISLFLKNFIFTPIYSAIITNQRWNVYYKMIFTPIIGAIMVIILCIVVQLINPINGWAMLIVDGITVVIFYCIFAILLLDSKERRSIFSKIDKFLGKTSACSTK